MVKNWSITSFFLVGLSATSIVLLESGLFESHLLLCLIFLIALVVLSVTILIKLKNNKTVVEILERDFARQNYTIISQRPLTIKETYENYELDFGLNYLSGTTTYSLLYRSKMVRYIVVKNEKDYYFELIVSIVHTWGNKYKYRILSKSRIRD